VFWYETKSPESSSVRALLNSRFSPRPLNAARLWPCDHRVAPRWTNAWIKWSVRLPNDLGFFYVLPSENGAGKPQSNERNSYLMSGDDVSFPMSSSALERPLTRSGCLLAPWPHRCTLKGDGARLSARRIWSVRNGEVYGSRLLHRRICCVWYGINGGQCWVVSLSPCRLLLITNSYIWTPRLIQRQPRPFLTIQHALVVIVPMRSLDLHEVIGCWPSHDGR